MLPLTVDVHFEIDDLTASGTGVVGVDAFAAINNVGAGSTARIHGDICVVAAAEFVRIAACTIDHGFRLSRRR